jgi:AmmeMemoRadiSam system protein A
MVRDMAVQSATADPRFFGRRLRPDELDDLKIEISVLSPLKKIDDPEADFELGKHGVYITDGLRSGCFLPQVALETGWSRDEFLSHCCAGKAGMAPDAWRDPGVDVSVFTAEILEEH